MTTTTKRLVTVITAGDSFASLEAWIYGEWAAHRRIAQRGWTVTYLPSGRKCTSRVMTEDRAKRVAERLHAEIAREDMLDWAQPSAVTTAKIQAAVKEIR